MRLLCWALGALCGLAAPARAWELEHTNGGAPLSWRTGSFDYRVRFEAGAPELSRAARSALDTWAVAARGGLSTRYLGPGAEPVGEDALNTVALLATWPESFGEPARTVGHTELFYDTTSGAIHEADILLNDQSFDFGDAPPGGFDLESVVLHEAGHALGLGHSCGDPGGTYPSCFNIPDTPPGTARRVLEAVMAPTLAAGAQRRRPNNDDLGGLAAAYPPRLDPGAAEVRGLERRCPGGQVAVLLGGAAAEDRLELRTADGSTSAPQVLAVEAEARLIPGEAPAEVDVLLYAPGGLRAARTALPWPDPCAAAPTPAPEGCACSTHRHSSGDSAMLVLVVLVAALLRGRRSLFALALAALFAAQPAWAFKCSRAAPDSGPSLVWMVRSIPWWADSSLAFDQLDHPASLAALKASFQAWEDVDCSDLTLPFSGEAADLKAGFDPNAENKNVVVQVRASWAYDPDVIAVTTNAFDTHSGVVVDSDIEINAVSFVFVDAERSCDTNMKNMMDLQNAITHEVGHVLGLDHPPRTVRNQESTMFASAPPCETKKRSLAEDDREGLCYIYPSGAAVVQCFPPDGPSFALLKSDEGYGCRCASTPPPASLALLAGVALLFGARALRRR